MILLPLQGAKRRRTRQQRAQGQLRRSCRACTRSWQGVLPSDVRYPSWRWPPNNWCASWR